MNLRLLPASGILVAALLAAGCQHDDQDALSIVVSLPQQDVSGVAKATLQIDYGGTGAKIVSEGSSPACAFILPGIGGDFADDHKGTLTIHTSGARALRGPADIAACRMKGASDASVADIQAKLVVHVAAAEDTAGKAIDLAAKSSKSRATGERSDSDIEAAQEEAVKAAAVAVPAPAPVVGAATPTTDPTHPATGAAGNPRTPSPGGAGAGATPPPPPPKPSQPTAPKATPAAPAILHNPAGAGAGASNGNGNDNGAVPASQDKDPGYDDSPSDDVHAPAYSLLLEVTSAVTFGALQLEITHLGNSGGFIGRQDQIECTSLVDAIVAANYVGERIAKIGMISLQGIRAPTRIASCGFRTREPLSPASFLVQVTDASDTDSLTLEPPPTVVISSITRR